ncbi:hypothetical protein [Acetobacter pasteurianus]|uniref:Uncharacterized protein n=1 Tax=Acetobacter pasteurianus NBRC 3188 TaxID=1226663 RepID=A0A401WRG0_ACEPA|nr:hypothetical protein [Acetobacter pasteurianus]QHM90875.1 hypothetical protein FCN51_04530 [Acetobacter pasteurianus]GCD51912.1 hypothetical protein NBRC3188_0609 [Acetobacter pasteurianus NBRC 3188]GCD55379.1 hypothetical protein NBRC3222_0716 [Acetobacter pasteurianus NBRC 3222]
MNTTSFMPPLDADRERDEGLEEASMRNALERLGASHKGRSAPSSPRPAADATGNKRRRFVRDGEVPVEKHSLARITPRTVAAPRTPTTSRAVHFSEEENSEVSRLRRLVAEEKLRVEDMERQMGEVQAAQRALQTQKGHADMMVRELKAKVAEQEAELAETGRQLRAAHRLVAERDEEIASLKRQVEAKPRGRPRRQYELAKEETVEDEPQPVKWWKD